MTIAACILAAGTSQRLGFPKQNLKIGSENLLESVARKLVAAGVAKVFVVTNRSVQVPAELFSLAELYYANHWSSGMGASLREFAATYSARLEEFAGLIVLPCDQPLVPTYHFKKMMEIFRGKDSLIVTTSYGIGNKEWGSPTLFGRRYFGELTEIGNHGGAKAVCKKHQDRLQFLDSPYARFDVDRPEDLVRIKNLDLTMVG